MRGERGVRKRVRLRAAAAATALAASLWALAPPAPAQEGPRGDAGATGPTGPASERAAPGEPREAAPASLETGVLRLGPAAVERMKRALSCHERWMGRPHGPISDAELPDVVARFQADLGLAPTGRLDLATLDLLGVSATVAISDDVAGSDRVRLAQKRAPEAGPQPPRGAATVGAGAQETPGASALVLGPDQIREIERRLVRAGFYKGPPQGAYTPELEVAIKKFQASWSIKPAQGLLDLRTLSWFPEAKVDVVLDSPSERNARSGGPGSAAEPLPASAHAPRATEVRGEKGATGATGLLAPGASAAAAAAPRATRVETDPADWVCPYCQEPVREGAGDCPRCLRHLGR